jgi:hypothetical protein
MNDKEINVGYDPEYKEGFVTNNMPQYKNESITNNMPQYHKIKMPEYYIAKHSDEDLRAAVLAEREACAKLCEQTYDKQIVQYQKGYYVDPNKMGEYSEKTAKRCAAAIRARGEK